MFLRTACLLPRGLDLTQKHFSEGWLSVEETTSAALDAKVRDAGWNFMWLKDVCSGIAVARTESMATAKAFSRALNSVKRAFNAAEFDALKVSKYPGFYVVKVTLYAHHIQQEPFLSLADDLPNRQFAAL
jgi:hypothetical protein